IPWIGIQATLGALVGASLVVGMAAWARTGGGLRSTARHPWGWAARGLGGAGVLGAAVIGWALLPAGIYHKSPVGEPRHLLFYREGNNATVSVVEEFDGVRSILVDSQPVAGTAGTCVVDQKMLAHLPLLLHPQPRRALTVGFGSGGTSHSMT